MAVQLNFADTCAIFWHDVTFNIVFLRIHIMGLIPSRTKVLDDESKSWKMMDGWASFYLIGQICYFNNSLPALLFYFIYLTAMVWQLSMDFDLFFQEKKNILTIKSIISYLKFVLT